MALSLFAGCKPASKPVGARPAPAELFGKWTLANSPKMSGNPPVPIPTKGNSWILLTSNRVANLTNVLVEEVFLPDGKTPPYRYRTTLKTENAGWDIEERGGFLSVQIDLKNNQTILLPIRQRGEAGFELSYQPDPEREPFIYVRDAKAKSQ
jgi:hypothetical protein